MGAGNGPVSPARPPGAAGSPAGKDEGGRGGLAQEASNAAMAIIGTSRIERIDGGKGVEAFFEIQGNVMALLLLEALGALLLLVFIVWWTMFSGRKNGELKEPVHSGTPAEPEKE
jgi:hypothetical protein